MITSNEAKHSSKELKENFKRLNMSLEEILKDTELTKNEFESVLNMTPDVNPSNVWKAREYFEYKLKEKGIEMYPFSKLANPRDNHWYYYDKPWINKNK